MHRSFVLPSLVVAFATLCSTGCGSGTATVSGTVTYRGKPVPGGSVVLYCQDKQIVRGMIEADGKYSIPNVPFGSVMVTVQSHARVPSGLREPQHLPPFSSGTPIPPAIGPAAGDSSDSPGVVIPPRYSLPEESGLAVIIDFKQLTYNIDLKP